MILNLFKFVFPKASSVIGFGFTLRFIVFTGLTIVIFFLCTGIIVHFSRVKLCLMLKVFFVKIFYFLFYRKTAFGKYME